MCVCRGGGHYPKEVEFLIPKFAHVGVYTFEKEREREREGVRGREIVYLLK